jgi:hypothetical protein
MVRMRSSVRFRLRAPKRKQVSKRKPVFFLKFSSETVLMSLSYQLKRSAGRACESKSEQYEESERRGTEHMRYVSTAEVQLDEVVR